jgi:hypothetical protein
VPSREWVNDKGEKQFSKLITFSSRAIADRFRDAILAALDAYLGVRS